MEVLRNILEEKQNDYEFIVTFPEMHYGKSHLQGVYKAQFQGRRQKYIVNLQEYEADILKLINLTYPTYREEIKQELAVNSFIQGLRDPEINQT